MKRSDLPAVITSAITKHAQEEPAADTKLTGASLIPTLNDLLKDEFVAIHEYTAHKAMAANWGFKALEESLLERLNDERKHADNLSERIAYLGGVPVANASVETANCATTVPDIFKFDLQKEREAVDKYNKAIAEAVAAGDNATRSILEANLRDEDDHVDENMTALDQIDMMSLGSYLVTQVE